jgi:hypothetical protein
MWSRRHIPIIRCGIWATKKKKEAVMDEEGAK